MLYRPHIITRRAALITGAAALALRPRDAMAATSAWDTKHAPYVGAFSNSDRTFSTNGSNQGLAFGHFGFASGSKPYWEVKVDALTATAAQYFGAGIASRYQRRAQNSRLGNWGIGDNNGGFVYYNYNFGGPGGFYGTDDTTFPSVNWPRIQQGNFVECCANLSTGKYWTRISGQNWNNDGAADPATDTGGMDISEFVNYGGWITAAVWHNDGGGTVTCTLNGGDAAFNGSVPSGFSAANNCHGYGSALTAKWDDTTSSNTTYIMSRLDGSYVASGIGTPGAVNGIRSNIAFTSPTYGEIWVEEYGTGAGAYVSLGFGNSSESLTTLNPADGVRVNIDNGKIYSGTTDTTYSTGTWGGSGNAKNVLCYAINPSTGRVWFRRNNGAWHNSGDPTAGTGGTAYSITGSIYLVAKMTLDSVAPQKASRAWWNAGQSAFEYTQPTGFGTPYSPVGGGARSRVMIFQ